MASGKKSPGILMRNAGIFNPVLVQAVGLCPVVAMATSVKTAALLAAISAVIITLSELFASLFLKSVPRWIRIGIYIILGGALVVPFMIIIERTNEPLFGSLGIYLPIMAVNSLNVLRCERFAVKISPLSALLDGITASVGYSAVLVLVGLIREVLGSGSIFGYRFFEGRTLSGLLLPFGGFLLLGFAGALLRTLISKFWPKYLDKKQPKPTEQKKKKTKEKSAPQVRQHIVTSIPEFTADESPFSLEDIAQEDENEHQPEENPTNEVEPDQQSKESVATEELPEPDNKPYEEIRQPEDSPETAEINNTPAEEEEKTVEADNASEEHSPPVFKELSLDDIDFDTSEYDSGSYSEDGENELEKLMNRSIGDILESQKKEEEE